MKYNQCFDILLSMLEKEEGESRAASILGIIHQYTSEATSTRLEEIMPTLLPVLTRCLKAEVSTIRRIAVYIFVQYRQKLPQKVAPYLKKLSLAHQKLIDVYSKRSSKE